MSFEAMRALSVVEARAAIRCGAYKRHTAGLAAGHLQANLVVLPEAYASDFAAFCQANPRPCPVVGVTDPGDPFFRDLGVDVDLRSDLPGYNIYRGGILAEQVSDLSTHWQNDLVGFALGCSFTFENAMLRAGIPLWHIAHDTTVPMYRTNIDLAPVGPFSGQMVVSMRALSPDHVAAAQEISGRYPWAHGAPIHVGDPREIGITDIETPDWGDPVPVSPDQLTCFWACGVTPQAVIAQAKLPFVITHAPGLMLITDMAETKDARPTHFQT
ncbi:MAG: putative hydro-lyase [Marinovum sp.]|nr:putative hydro-lyase [Marinovum sp.]